MCLRLKAVDYLYAIMWAYIFHVLVLILGQFHDIEHFCLFLHKKILQLTLDFDFNVET